ncbi:MAG: serine/threonine-protein kinase, partial [Planctomycetaceae bacterium]
MITRKCPSKNELSQYTLGTLREDFVVGLEKHLVACPVCSETIQVLESQTDSFTGMFKNTQAPQDVNLLNEGPFLSAVANLARMSIVDSFVGPGIHQHLGISSTSHLVPQPVRQLGQYTLLEVVGSGGMGLVYRARQEKLNKIVALKLLSAARVHDPHMQVRFHREMLAAGTIDHPNVVRALDADEVDGVHFLVMEFVDGVDLSALLKQLGPLSVEHACSMTRMAAVGLSQIHLAGMVHRDVKPGNLMLSKEGQVKILDLGLALLNPNHSPVGDDLSSASHLMGTVDYMPPEQANNTHEVDFRADIYGLGATLFALLTGRRPLGDRQQTLMQKLFVLANKPVPSLLRFRADIPKDLAEFVSAMLNRDPGLRPASAAEVAVALEAYASDQGLQDLVRECCMGKENIAAGRFDTVDDTMILYAASDTPTVSRDAVVVASSTVAPTNQNRKATLSFGFAALLIGTLLFGT